MTSDRLVLYGVIFAAAAVLASVVLKAFKFKNFVKTLEFVAFFASVLWFLFRPLISSKAFCQADCVAAGTVTACAVVSSVLLIVARGLLDR